MQRFAREVVENGGTVLGVASHAEDGDKIRTAGLISLSLDRCWIKKEEGCVVGKRGWLAVKKIKARSMQSPHTKTMMLFRAETERVESSVIESSVVLSNGGICGKPASLSVPCR